MRPRSHGSWNTYWAVSPLSGIPPHCLDPAPAGVVPGQRQIHRITRQPRTLWPGGTARPCICPCARDSSMRVERVLSIPRSPSQVPGMNWADATCPGMRNRLRVPVRFRPDLTCDDRRRQPGYPCRVLKILDILRRDGGCVEPRIHHRRTAHDPGSFDLGRPPETAPTITAERKPAARTNAKKAATPLRNKPLTGNPRAAPE